MVARFYGSHVKSVRNRGTAFVDKEVEARNKRVEALTKKYDVTSMLSGRSFDADVE